MERVVVMFLSGVEPGWGAATAHPGSGTVGDLREDRSDAGDRALDPAGQRREDADHRDRDHREDDPVLGHRLALLRLPESPEEVLELGKSHLLFTSFSGL